MCQDCEDKPAMMSKPSFDDQFSAIMKDKGVGDDVGTVIKERDALKQRVDDQAVAMTTALEALEGLMKDPWKVNDARDVLAKALRKGGE